LWYVFLSKQQPRFQRQKVILSFIVDFYCHAAQLVIEVDGSQHHSDQGAAYDFERTKLLEELGLTVLRFTNREIDLNFEGTCQTIREHIQRYHKTLQSEPCPPP